MIHALLLALHEGVEGLVEMARTNAPPESESDGKPYERLFSAQAGLLTVYHANAALVIQIKDA